MPGDPQDVIATPLNSTSIHVTWKPPLEKARNGIIRGYHIHVQEAREEVCFQPYEYNNCNLYLGIIEIKTTNIL